MCSPTTSWALSTGWDSEATAPQALVDIEFDLTVTGVCLAEVDLTLDRAGDTGEVGRCLPNHGRPASRRFVCGRVDGWAGIPHRLDVSAPL